MNESDLRSDVHYLGSSENKAWKKYKPVRDLNPWPLRYRCSALLNFELNMYRLSTELFEHGDKRYQKVLTNDIGLAGVLSENFARCLLNIPSQHIFLLFPNF